MLLITFSFVFYHLITASLRSHTIRFLWHHPLTRNAHQPTHKIIKNGWHK